MDQNALKAWVDSCWEESILPALEDYIRIPCKSPLFDPDWERAGHIEAAVELIRDWCAARPIKGIEVEVVRLAGRTPVILMEIPGTGDETVLLYGHFDKQPEMEGWDAELGPWQPVRRDGRLYGRGGADDGYAAFASLAAIEALQAQGLPHGRCVVLIEACEESGSYDLAPYVEHLAERIGQPSLVICLDSGCGNYDQLWTTTSLRGMAGGVLRVEVLKEGVHSGGASGVVPSSFRIARSLLSRLEDEDTGRLLPPELQGAIPEERRLQAQLAAEELGDGFLGSFPLVPTARPMDLSGEAGPSGAEHILACTWRPTLSVTGAAGLPPLDNAGNVLRPMTALKLSLRLPPSCDSARASQAVKELLEADPPHGARVSYEAGDFADGWNAPPTAEWLAGSIEQASHAFYGRRALHMGEGGTIPFMAMLGERFPEAQYLITGLLGPGSNAHGPNEFLHIPSGKRLTCCVAKVLTDHN
ncbi:MAG: M20/M25/M40 family metallo-hydrolase, partial [Planctomycetota bacterium]|nr:M20/M25/M40 family metallo-hydrolase [Planctomycetota bacterium]